MDNSINRFSKLRATHMTVLLLLLLGSSTLYAQIKVQGKVTDNTNAPMVGVTVSQKGTPISTVTNPEGNFTLSVKNEQSVLVFTSVGYQPQEITVGNKTTLDLQLTA